MSASGPADLETFVESAQRVVDYLRERTPLTDWSVSRIDDDDQVHLHVSGTDVLHVGDRVPWESTFCRRMLRGAARIVPDSQQDDDYADLPAAERVRAYAGFPIVDHDGSTFGTLCGVRTDPLGSEERLDEELLAVFSTLLSGQLALVRASTSQRDSALASAALANSDALTGLMNRRGWDLVMAEAQRRVEALGDHGGLIMIDLDDLKAVNDSQGHQGGDALLCSAARALDRAAGPGHAVARYGGDEFVVYAGGARPAELDGVADGYREALAGAGVAASLGWAPVMPGDDHDVRRALALADAAMYDDKRRRRAAAADLRR